MEKLQMKRVKRKHSLKNSKGRMPGAKNVNTLKTNSAMLNANGNRQKLTNNIDSIIKKYRDPFPRCYMNYEEYAEILEQVLTFDEPIGYSENETDIISDRILISSEAIEDALIMSYEKGFLVGAFSEIYDDPIMYEWIPGCINVEKENQITVSELAYFNKKLERLSVVNKSGANVIDSIHTLMGVICEAYTYGYIIATRLNNGGASSGK